MIEAFLKWFCGEHLWRLGAGLGAIFSMVFGYGIVLGGAMILAAICERIEKTKEDE